MCGIVGAVAERDIIPILLEGLRRLEYRGYDSAGIAAISDGKLLRRRRLGKVEALESALQTAPVEALLGIAHTRWATHGVPSEANAHPHMSGDDLAIVHNGIIENHEALRAELTDQGYKFETETDTEVIAHRIHHYLRKDGDLMTAVRATVADLEGAYALVVISQNNPDRLILARRAMPVVVGLGKGENFVASDVAALIAVTRDFIFLEEGDIADVRKDKVTVTDETGKTVDRPVSKSELSAGATEKDGYSHYMLKEIYEQPRAVA